MVIVQVEIKRTFASIPARMCSEMKADTYCPLFTMMSFHMVCVSTVI